jgi:hypothetical protein
MQNPWATASNAIGLSKPILQRTATRGNTSRRIVAPKVAGSSPVGHPLETAYLSRKLRVGDAPGHHAEGRWQQ